MAPKGPRHAPLPPTGIGAAQDVNELVGRMSVRDFNPRTLSGPHDTLAQLRVRACPIPAPNCHRNCHRTH
jgi:hypothetical protein